MTHTAQVRASLAEIPAHKWRAKITRFVFALLLGALLCFVALPQHWSSTIVLVIAAAIGYCISADLMSALVRFLVAAIRDVVAAIGKNGATSPPPAPPPASPPAPRIGP
jgi:hypothetical protein